MPLTRKGKEVLRSFKKEYGRRVGRNIFYAYMNKHKHRTKRFHANREKIKSNLNSNSRGLIHSTYFKLGKKNHLDKSFASQMIRSKVNF